MLTNDGILQGVLNVMPLPTPSKRHNLLLRLGGGGGRIQSGAEKKGRGCNYHEVGNDNDDNDDDGGGKGGSKGRSINDSIS